MGTPNFACPTLEKLFSEKDFEIVAVYTKEPQIAGRGQRFTNSPIHDLALKYNLKVLTPKTLKNPDIQKEFESFEADIAVVVAYGLLLPEQILNGTKFGCVNIHPSLLPRWRGAAPIQRTIMSGDKESGITIIKMDKGLDSGDMICQEKITLSNQETSRSLSEKFSVMGAEILVKTLNDIKSGNYSLTSQDHSLTTYAKKIEKEECKIDWNLSAQEIDLKIRGLNGSIEAFFYYNEEKIKIFSAEIFNNDSRFLQKNCGEVLTEDFLIKCSDSVIKPLILQRQGKKVVNIKDFLLGFKPEVGRILS